MSEEASQAMFRAFNDWLDNQAVPVDPSVRAAASSAFYGGWQAAEAKADELHQLAGDPYWRERAARVTVQRRVQEAAMKETNDLLRRILAHLERGRGVSGSAGFRLDTSLDQVRATIKRRDAEDARRREAGEL